MMESAETVFPEPLSPTRATVSPAIISKEIFFTAWVVLFEELKSTDRFRTSTSASEFKGLVERADYCLAACCCPVCATIFLASLRALLLLMRFFI